MTNILKFILLLPFKNRTIGFITLLIVLVSFFRYFELQPSGENKELSIGPITLHVNPVTVHRRSTTTTNPNDYTDGSTIVPTLPVSVSTQTTPMQSQVVNKPIDQPTVLTQCPDGRFHPTVPVSDTQTRQPSVPDVLDGAFSAPVPVHRDAIRIGTICLDNMNVQKMSDPVVLETLVRTAHEFDLLAVQGFYDTDINAVKKWVDALNLDGSMFGFLTSYPPESKRDKDYKAPFVAFLYNRRAVDADRNTLLVLEAGDRLFCSPIAALFTTRSTENLPAFTFIILNAWINPANAQTELGVLQQTFPIVREHIRGEDDVIILGDFGTNINYVPDIVRNPQLNWVFTGQISNYRNQYITANMLFYDNSVTEFKNQSGTFNVEKLTGLSAMQIQTFMPNPPLWGKFNVTEMRKK